MGYLASTAINIFPATKRDSTYQSKSRLMTEETTTRPFKTAWGDSFVLSAKSDGGVTSIDFILGGYYVKIDNVNNIIIALDTYSPNTSYDLYAEALIEETSGTGYVEIQGTDSNSKYTGVNFVNVASGTDYTPSNSYIALKLCTFKVESNSFEIYAVNFVKDVDLVISGDFTANDLDVNDIEAHDLDVHDIDANEITATTLNVDFIKAKGSGINLNGVLTTNDAINASGLVTANGGVKVPVNKTFENDGTTQLDGATNVNGAFNVNNNTAQFSQGINVANGASVAGTASFSGTVNANNGLNVKGTFNVKNGNTNKFQVTNQGATTQKGKLTVEAGGADITGDVAIDGAVTSTGSVTASGGFFSNGLIAPLFSTTIPSDFNDALSGPRTYGGYVTAPPANAPVGVTDCFILLEVFKNDSYILQRCTEIGGAYMGTLKVSHRVGHRVGTVWSFSAWVDV